MENAVKETYIGEKKKGFFSTLRKKPIVEKCLKMVTAATVAWNITTCMPSKTDAYISDVGFGISKITANGSNTNEKYSGDVFEMKGYGLPLAKITHFPKELMDKSNYETWDFRVTELSTTDPVGAFKLGKHRLGPVPIYLGLGLKHMKELDKDQYTSINKYNGYIGTCMFFDFFRSPNHKLSIWVDGNYSWGKYERSICKKSQTSPQGDEILGSEIASIYGKEFSLELTYGLFAIYSPGIKANETYILGISPFVYYSEEEIKNEIKFYKNYGIELKCYVFSLKLEKDSEGTEKTSIGVCVAWDSIDPDE